MTTGKTDTTKKHTIIARITHGEHHALDKETKSKNISVSQWIRLQIANIRGTRQ